MHPEESAFPPHDKKEKIFWYIFGNESEIQAISAKQIVSLGANPYAKDTLNKYVATYFREWPDTNKTFTRKSNPTTGKCKVKN